MDVANSVVQNNSACETAQLVLEFSKERSFITLLNMAEEAKIKIVPIRTVLTK